MAVSPKRLIVEQNGENFSRRWVSRGGGGSDGDVYQVWGQSAQGLGRGRAATAIGPIGHILKMSKNGCISKTVGRRAKRRKFFAAMGLAGWGGV